MFALYAYYQMCELISLVRVNNNTLLTPVIWLINSVLLKIGGLIAYVLLVNNKQFSISAIRDSVYIISFD